MKHPTERILWAIDPFAEKKLQLKTLEAIKNFTKNAQVTIEPITVLSPDQLRLPIQAFHAESANFRLKAEEILQKWLKEVKVPGLKPYTLLVSDKYSLRSSADLLMTYAKDSNASLIALSTHARKGIARVLAGSFAETLLLHASTPLLVVNPQVKTSKVTKILFPTDMSASSEQAFQQVVTIASHLKAKVILYHKVEYVIPDTYSVFTHHKAYEQYLEKDLESREEELKTWVTKAKETGVKAELVFDKKPSFVTQGVLKAVKQSKSEVLAICSHTGSIGTMMLGSVTRQILREAKCPVWTVHV